MDATITESIEVKPPPRRRTISSLTFLCNADDPRAASSYHALDDIDEVRFRRGPRGATRDGRTLHLALEDARMSSAHGSVRRRGARWLLEDLRSKNGAVVNGAVTRQAELADGSVFELGRSFFVFRSSLHDGELPDRLTGDVAASQLSRLATFSPGLAVAYDELARLAASSVSIVLCGETGTGKEVVAKAIHDLSGRKGAFIPVNCGALPATLVEAELFGHRRGAFSGAVADRRGLVRSADGGTLFLDEIGELPLPAQTALLRVVQEREVVPVGDDHPVPVDVHIVAATLRDLDIEVAAGRFRRDLHARLAGRTFTLAPLRERREDLGLFLSALLGRLASRPVRFTPPALRALLLHDWPNNIRELEQVLRGAIALTTTGAIDLDHLPAMVRGECPRRPDAPQSRLDPDARQLREELVALLAANHGNVVHVAQALGKRRAQIYKWVKRFAIDLESFRRP